MIVRIKILIALIKYTDPSSVSIRMPAAAGLSNILHDWDVFVISLSMGQPVISTLVSPFKLPYALRQSTQSTWPHGSACSGGSIRQEKQAEWLMKFFACPRAEWLKKWTITLSLWISAAAWASGRSSPSILERSSASRPVNRIYISSWNSSRCLSNENCEIYPPTASTFPFLSWCPLDPWPPTRQECI